MADEKNPRIQRMVPDRDKVIEHGQQPTIYIKPPKPPAGVPNSGIGNATKKNSSAAQSGDAQ